MDSFVHPSIWWVILNTIEFPLRSCGKGSLPRIDGSLPIPIRRRGSLLCNERSKLLYDTGTKPTRVEDRSCVAEDTEFRLVFPFSRNPWQPSLVSGHRPSHFRYGKIVRSRSRHLWASQLSPAFYSARRGFLLEPMLLHASGWTRPCSTSPAGVLRRASLSSSHVVWRARVRRHRSDRARRKVQEIENTIRRANTSRSNGPGGANGRVTGPKKSELEETHRWRALVREHVACGTHVWQGEKRRGAVVALGAKLLLGGPADWQGRLLDNVQRVDVTSAVITNA